MKSKWTLSIALSLLMSASLMAQSWDRLPGGNIINGTEYLGAATGSTVPLLLKTVPPLLSIDLATTDILRARLKPTGTATINGYGGVVQDGFFLLSGQPDAFTNVNSKAPFTRMHLVDPTGSVNPINYAQQFGFRPWQKNGITFTGNSDQGYIGQKYNYNDATDMVIQWSDNPSTDPWASDKLRFISAANPTAAPRVCARWKGWRRCACGRRALRK
ncbi:MAG: hypothetical protein IPN85_18370 [Flavobacteriales bacterium]|nr:hypothetical protein [Flavobacteriales bacterium]